MTSNLKKDPGVIVSLAYELFKSVISHLYFISDFYFNFTVARRQSLYDIYSLKFAGVYKAYNIANFYMFPVCLKKNVYSNC